MPLWPAWEHEPGVAGSAPVGRRRWSGRRRPAWAWRWPVTAATITLVMALPSLREVAGGRPGASARPIRLL